MRLGLPRDAASEAEAADQAADSELEAMMWWKAVEGIIWVFRLLSEVWVLFEEGLETDGKADLRVV